MDPTCWSCVAIGLGVLVFAVIAPPLIYILIIKPAKEDHHE